MPTGPGSPRGPDWPFGPSGPSSPRLPRAPLSPWACTHTSYAIKKYTFLHFLKKLRVVTTVFCMFLAKYLSSTSCMIWSVICINNTNSVGPLKYCSLILNAMKRFWAIIMMFVLTSTLFRLNGKTHSVSFDAHVTLGPWETIFTL